MQATSDGLVPRSEAAICAAVYHLEWNHNHRRLRNKIVSQRITRRTDPVEGEQHEPSYIRTYFDAPPIIPSYASAYMHLRISCFQDEPGSIASPIAALLLYYLRARVQKHTNKSTRAKNPWYLVLCRDRRSIYCTMVFCIKSIVIRKALF